MITIFPQPAEMKETGGTFQWNATKTVWFGDAFCSLRPFFFDLLKTEMAEDKNGDVQFIEDASLKEEQYRISIGREQLIITAAGHNGAFYAIQTLRQLGKFDRCVPDSLPCVEINDYPRFAWRGLSLDEGRHFFGMDTVKAYLDRMAMHKLNVFHWHLTDDQGWRIEIKKYPLLTEIGSKRVGSQSKGWQSPFVDDIPVEGYYTQDQIREIVQYAAERGIMIVPEIDMPAHFAAALAGYNWLACRDIPWEVPNYYGRKVPLTKLGLKDWNRPACPGKETTYEFIYHIIDEVVPLFPSGFFHIGGDECPKDEWKKCPHCQAMIREQGLKNEEELQAYFTNQIKKYLEKKNVRLVGWNEILKGKNLDQETVVQYWTPQRDRRAENYVNQGGQMVMSKHHAFYFDLTYAQYPLKNTYTFEPDLGSIKPENIHNVLGVEGEMWTEFIADTKKLELNLYPRMQALCEVAWSPKEQRNWKGFLTRLFDFMPTLDALGIHYAEQEVFSPKWYKRPKIQSLFQNGDPCYELKLNQKAKAQKKK